MGWSRSGKVKWFVVGWVYSTWKETASSSGNRKTGLFSSSDCFICFVCTVFPQVMAGEDQVAICFSLLPFTVLVWFLLYSSNGSHWTPFSSGGILKYLFSFPSSFPHCFPQGSEYSHSMPWTPGFREQFSLGTSLLWWFLNKCFQKRAHLLMDCWSWGRAYGCWAVNPWDACLVHVAEGTARKLFTYPEICIVPLKSAL